MDDIAVDLGIDPLEIRMRNAFHEGSASPTGQVLQSVVVKDSKWLPTGLVGRSGVNEA